MKNQKLYMLHCWDQDGSMMDPIKFEAFSSAKEFFAEHCYKYGHNYLCKVVFFGDKYEETIFMGRDFEKYSENIYDNDSFRDTAFLKNPFL